MGVEEGQAKPVTCLWHIIHIVITIVKTIIITVIIIVIYTYI